MNEIFISDFFDLNYELDELGVFDAIITKDSHFFINLLRLKKTKVLPFCNSYQKINLFFSDIMRLLKASKAKNDKFYREALRRFSFSGVKGINLGFSETGVDAGFGRLLTKRVISDAFDIVKTGSTQPEIFQLVGLFEENIAADRLSDMIATLISDDIREYTRWVNRQLGINSNKYSNIIFNNNIAWNPYKNCEILYLPKDIIHELPIARDWSDIDRVISENKAIRCEVNQAIGEVWHKMDISQRKCYLREHIFKNKDSCARVIEGYKDEIISQYSPNANWDYFLADSFRKMRCSGVFNFLEHSNKCEITSWEASLKVLGLCKDFIENMKGWDIVLSVPTVKAEKIVQRLLHSSGLYYCEQNNIDMSFEANEGPGPVDLKVSRGTDKTVVEIKLSSNPDYIHGFEEQIEEYAKAEHTSQRIFVYVKNGNHPIRDKVIKEKYKEKKDAGENPPYLYIIDSRERPSASKRE